jgi:uncharacterized protein YeaO (DUF488 family)
MKHLEKAWDRFNSKYKEEIKEDFVDLDIFESFRDDLKELKITPPSGIYDMGDFQKEKDEYLQKYPNIFKWIKNRLTS